MNGRFPLYLKIVLWFFLNLLLLAVIGYFVVAGQFGLDLLLSGPVASRIGAVSEALTSELRSRPRSEWDALLEHRSSAYGVKFLLFQDDSTQLAGNPTVLPPDIKRSLRGPPLRRHLALSDKDSRRRNDGRLRPEFDDSPSERAGTDVSNVTRLRFETILSSSASNTASRPFPPLRPRFVIRTVEPTRYWIGMPAFLGAQSDDLPRFCTLLIVSNNLYGGGLFFDAKPFLIAGGWVLLFSILFWFPLVRGITRSLALMTHATERIAQGRFDARVRIRRRDELGQLGRAVNRMAERLEGFVTGQKRFLGDTAHELCTPLARIQMAVGILEQRADSSAQPYVQDVREEVQQMSGLVAELLSFSKASLAKTELKLQPVSIQDIVSQALEREAKPESNIKVEMEYNLLALGDPDLLQRALANLLRNAVRYAGHNGPITISGSREPGAVLLKVTDSGPGVSNDLLQRLFDPFFRVDDARARENGGVGLGLTIVKTCVEACGGSVTCRNRQPSGLEVVLRLNPASVATP